jgi:hypothetical protein
MKNLPEGAGSPISRMPQKTEDGLQPTHQPTTNMRTVEKTEDSQAVKDWQSASLTILNQELAIILLSINFVLPKFW